MAQITTNALRRTWRGKDQWLSDGGARGAGRLIARITRGGVDFYYQYFASDGRRRFLLLGPYEAAGTRGLSLPQARDRAAELSALYRRGTTDLHAHFEQLRSAEETARNAKQESERRAQEDAQRGTLKELLDIYVAHLNKSGKQSASDVENIFKNHVFDARPDLVRRKAAEITIDEFVEVIGRVVEANKGRTAGKLRSYIRAAYSLALHSKTDPAAPLVLKTFGITFNPIASIGALSQFNRSRERNLSASELGSFLRRLDAEPAGPKRDALDLNLTLGGQRPTQLLRARPVDVDLQAQLMTVYDPKGARRQPRVHVIPLTSAAVVILKRRLDAVRGIEGSPIFTTDGETILNPGTLSEMVKTISREMVKAGEAREAFQLRDLRRTMETMLARLGVTKDVRGQLQSHGLGGVQNRHYDRHDYFREKRDTLELLRLELDALRSGDHPSVAPILQRDLPTIRAA